MSDAEGATEQAAPEARSIEDPYEDLEIPPGAVAQPGTSRVNETGTWRESKPVIDHDRCTGCGQCALYCPDTAVIDVEGFSEADAELLDDGEDVETPIEDRFVSIDYRYCKGCSICDEVCPVDAIETVPEVK